MNVRSLLRRSLQAIRYAWHRSRQHARLLHQYGWGYYLSWTRAKAALWVRDRWSRRYFPALDDREVSRCRRSDKVFIFGSGYSLNELTDEEWHHFAEHDVFGFSGFIYQSRVRVDFHLIRGWDGMVEGLQRLARTSREYAEQIVNNEKFKDTVFIIQEGVTAMFGNVLTGYRLLPAGVRVYRYRTVRRVDRALSHNLRHGVNHEGGTLADCVNLAYLLGWKEIVLVGVDLYDSRYFWGPPGGTLQFDATGRAIPAEANDHGIKWNETHKTVELGIVAVLGEWAKVFQRYGVSLSVYNPSSRLNQVLPIYGREQASR